MVDRGINELFEGITITRSSYKSVLPPSAFAEAEIGHMSTREVRLGLEEVIEQVVNDENVEAPAIRRALVRNSGEIGFDDLVEKVKARHEGRPKLITAKPIKSEMLSGGGVRYFVIRRRGDSRGARERQVTIALDSGGNIANYSCVCEQYGMNLAKGNYAPFETDKKGDVVPSVAPLDAAGFPTFVTYVGCYHVAAALLHISKTSGDYSSPFEFTKLSVFEALFMDVFSGVKDAEIDDYLIRQGSLTKDTSGQVRDGRMTLEVLKHSRNISKRSREIIRDLSRSEEQNNYVFSGFARDFRETPYRTTSVVLTDPDGKAIHLLYDENLFELPLVMFNVPVATWLAEGNDPVSARFEGDLRRNVDRSFLNPDARTGQFVVSTITTPDARFLEAGDMGAYSGFKGNPDLFG
jgi:hypothetical protein